MGRNNAKKSNIIDKSSNIIANFDLPFHKLLESKPLLEQLRTNKGQIIKLTTVLS